MASAYPTAIDSVATLLAPRDKSSGKSIATTTTASILSGDTTIPVADTNSTGFPSSYGVLVIGDEQIIYTGKTATSFTGCARGQFGTTASGHASGVAVRGLFVAGYLERIHEALVAIETTLGTDGAYNFLAAAATLVSSFAGRTGAVTPANGDYTAAQITNTPSGNLAASTVQAALNELQSDVDGRAASSHTHAIADTTGLQSALDGKAPLASPAFTGNPTAPTPATNDNDTSIATTEWVKAQGYFSAAGGHSHAASDINSGQLALARGGTGADLSATGGTGQVLRQSSAGAGITVSALAAADIPTLEATKINPGNVSSTQFGYVSGARSNIQDQIDGKAELVHVHNASTDITSGLLPVTRGGTGANLSATGGTYHFVRQTTAGGAFAVAAIVADDLPTIPNSKLANASVTVTAGSGLGGGGTVALGSSTTITAKVVTVFGREGNITAFAGDYHAGQIDLNGSSLGSTVSAALASLDSNKASNSWVGSLESSVGSLNTAMSQVQSATSSLDSRATSLEGRMTAAENAISSLLGRVSALESSSHSH